MSLDDADMSRPKGWPYSTAKTAFRFASVLDENEVVPCEPGTSLRMRLAECKQAKFALKSDQPTAYVIR